MVVGKKLIAVAAAVVIIGAGALTITILSRSGKGDLERALPSTSSQTYVVAVSENPGRLTERINTTVSDLLNEVRIGGKKLVSEDWSPPQFSSIANLADRTAALFVFKDESQKNLLSFFVAFHPKEKEFNEFISEGSSIFAVAPEERSSGEGWTLRLKAPFVSGKPLYMYRAKKSASENVYLAGSWEDIARMLDAKKTSSKRLKVTRHNTGPDYLQIHMSVKNKAGESRPATTEAAWIEDKESGHLQIYSDVHSKITNRSVPKSGERGDDLPLLGGELALVGGVDTAYLCFLLAPSAEDPVGVLVDKYGDFLNGSQRESVRKILTDGRISVVATMDPESKDPLTRYLVLETKERDALNSLAMFPRMFMRSLKLEGWDTVHVTSLSREYSIVLAQRKDILLMGLGSAQQYEKKASVPKDIEKFAAPRDLCNLVATPAAWPIAWPYLQEYAMKAGINIGNFFPEPCTIQLRVMTPEKSDIGFYWTEKKK